MLIFNILITLITKTYKNLYILNLKLIFNLQFSAMCENIRSFLSPHTHDIKIRSN